MCCTVWAQRIPTVPLASFRPHHRHTQSTVRFPSARRVPGDPTGQTKLNQYVECHYRGIHNLCFLFPFKRQLFFSILCVVEALARTFTAECRKTRLSRPLAGPQADKTVSQDPLDDFIPRSKQRTRLSLLSYDMIDQLSLHELFQCRLLQSHAVRSK